MVLRRSGRSDLKEQSLRPPAPRVSWLIRHPLSVRELSLRIMLHVDQWILGRYWEQCIRACASSELPPLLPFSGECGTHFRDSCSSCMFSVSFFFSFLLFSFSSPGRSCSWCRCLSSLRMSRWPSPFLLRDVRLVLSSFNSACGRRRKSLILLVLLLRFVSFSLVAAEVLPRELEFSLTRRVLVAVWNDFLRSITPVSFRPFTLGVFYGYSSSSSPL